MKYNSQITKQNIPDSKGCKQPKVFLISVTLLITFLFSNTAHAGIFSFVSSLLSTGVDAKVQSNPSNENSQSIPLLQAAVNSDPNMYKASPSVPVADGETLVADMVSLDASASTTVNTQIGLYTVRKGDTVSSIAKMFGVSANTIIWANDLTRTSVLQNGQTLVILPVSGITYIVKNGDTVKGIVLKYKANLNEVLQYNDITVSSVLKIGQAIIIPDVELTPSIPTKYVFKYNPPHDTNGPDFPGYYMRPITGGVETQGLHGYNAVDLADRTGTPIYAAAPGTVIVSMFNGKWNGGYGNFIIISHPNNTQTLYGHLSKNVVHSGETVDRGQEIGLMGATGEATGPHLHFEIRGARNPF